MNRGETKHPNATTVEERGTKGRAASFSTLISGQIAREMEGLTEAAKGESETKEKRRRVMRLEQTRRRGMSLEQTRLKATRFEQSQDQATRARVTQPHLNPQPTPGIQCGRSLSSYPCCYRKILQKTVVWQLISSIIQIGS